MPKRVKGCLDFSDAVAPGENSNGIVTVAPSGDLVGDNYMGRQQWPNDNRDGERFGPFATPESFFPSAVMAPPPKKKR